MLARALFLLRFATAGINRVFKEANLSKENISFWWEEFGIRYGFWDNNSLPEEFIDSLWPDIEDVISELQEKIIEGDNRYENPKSIDLLSLRDINCLTELNKIPLWGFGL